LAGVDISVKRVLSKFIIIMPMNIIRAVKQKLPASVKKIIRKTVLPGNAGRNLAVTEDDVFIVSYPKSGNTWTRFLIGNLFYKDEEITFANIESKVPDIYQNTDRYLLKLPRPRLIKSHEYFDPRYRRVIYIVRDPRSVAVSYYHYMIKRRTLDEKYPIGLFIECFLRGELDLFGGWGDNVGSWIGARDGSKDFLLLRYEDLLLNAAGELRKVATFLELQVSDTEIEHAIENSSFERMRSLENEQASNWKAIASSRLDKPFMRSGKADGWSNELSFELVQSIECKWGALMKKLNYKLM
jgi:hypothetical protein